MNNANTRACAKAALQLSFIADALAMPVHWFYNPLDIYAAFPGGIKKFEAAPQVHPLSFMNLPLTNADDHSPQVVGDIILKVNATTGEVPTNIITAAWSPVKTH